MFMRSSKKKPLSLFNKKNFAFFYLNWYFIKFTRYPFNFLLLSLLFDFLNNITNAVHWRSIINRIEDRIYHTKKKLDKT